MKNNILFIVLASVTLLAASCKKDYQIVNTDPNQVNDSKPEFMFTDATFEYMRKTRADAMAQYDKAFIYTQYLVPNDAQPNELGKKYITSSGSVVTFPSPGAGEYENYFQKTGRDYRRLLAKIDGIQDTLVKASYVNLRAVTVILDVYEAWKVVDLYGGLPYHQAFDPIKYPTSEFNYGWDLYKEFDQKLKESVSILKATTGTQTLAKNDFFYDADWSKWAKFANSLRIRIAQRYEKRDAANLSAVLSDIGNNSNIIAANSESFGYTYSPDWGLNNYDDVDNIRKNYVAGYAFVEFLKSTKDPRIAFMIRPNDWGTNSPRYNEIKSKGTAAALKTLDSADVNKSRYIGKRAFPLSAGNATYGWNGSTRDHSFVIMNGTSPGSVTLAYQSLLQTRLVVKNGGFKEGNAELFSDETVVTLQSISFRLSLMNYADVCFMMAEIAAKGLNGLGKTAAEWYNEGVKASFEFYKALAIANGTPNASNVNIGQLLTSVPYKGLESIYSQAWVNFLITPEEGYALMKRTGYPQLVDSRVGQPQKIGDGSGIAYLEKLYSPIGESIIPTRAVLQYAASPEMHATIDKAAADMFAKDAGYLKDRQNSSGRIWWNVK